MHCLCSSILMSFCKSDVGLTTIRNHIEGTLDGAQLPAIRITICPINFTKENWLKKMITLKRHQKGCP
ncbi:hypothetical protein Hanom_Chr03g00265541 [Helianthus anomalus]